MKALTIVTIALMLAIVAGCGGEGKPEASLRFLGHDLSEDGDGNHVIRLGIRNDGETAFPGEEFEGAFELRYTSKYGDLIASDTAALEGPIQPGEEVFPFVWKGDLPQSGYYLWWGADGYGGVEVEFLVQLGGGSGRAGVGGIMEMTYREVDASGKPTARY